MSAAALKIMAIIPARGGSKGIPRKNIRFLNGKPLISYSIETAKGSKYIQDVVVSTDDDEIAQLSEKYGAKVMMRSPQLASDEVPLDPVIYDTLIRYEQQHGTTYDVVLTVQPTSPLLNSDTVDQVIERLLQSGADTIITAVDDRHLAWTKREEQYLPKYAERKNRQYLPQEFRETGAVLASRRAAVTENSRIGGSVSLFEVSRNESIDIDSALDWWVAEKLLKRKKLVIRVDGYKEIGLGHIYRALTIAESIMDHDVLFLMDERHELGIRLVKARNYRVQCFTGDVLAQIRELKPDIVINDILDTSKEYIRSLKELGVKVYNFEDLGDGAEYADGVFNALYPGTVPSAHFYTGQDYYCPRNEFLVTGRKQVRDEVKKVLITYGGTDPNNLTLRTLQVVAESPRDFEISVILGPGYTAYPQLERMIARCGKKVAVHREIKNMADHMLEADLIFSSAGRTMYEIAMIGTPAMIISQNYREMTHLFGHSYNGFLNLGLHSEVTDSMIAERFERMMSDPELRKTMSQRMLQHDLRKGIDRVLTIIFN